MSAAAKFRTAVQFIKDLPSDGDYSPSNQEKLSFYALFKQATKGDVSGKRPGAWSMVARAKYDAWAKLRGTSKEDAMKQYTGKIIAIASSLGTPEAKQVVAKLQGGAPKPSAPTAARASPAGSGGLVLYGTPISQPTRAVRFLLEANRIPYTFKLVRLERGEHLKPEFAKLNVWQKVPVLDDNGFVLHESHAIMRYVCAKFRLPDHWLPRDVKVRAQVEELLDWHHHATRNGAAVVGETLLRPMRGLPVRKKMLAARVKLLHKAVGVLETHYLAGGRRFLAGTDKPTIADASIACELKQLVLVKHVDISSTKFRNVARWLATMEKQPGFSRVHSALNKMASRL